MFSRRRSVVTVLLLSAGTASAADSIDLAPLEVTSTRVTSTWLETPAAISSVSVADKPGEQLLTLDGLLSAVPGTVSQSRYNMAQGMRLSIRGFGARSSFGMRGIRVMVDGVPLTMPDGQTEMDGVDLGLVERVEVIRGSASTLYGNGAGGVLAIQTREPSLTPTSTIDVSGGEYGYQRLRAETSGTSGNVGGLLALNVTNMDGYREHSTSEARNLTGKVRWQGDNGQLGVTFQALDNRWEDPGALNLQQVRADRGQARPESLKFNSDETITQQRLAVNWTADLDAANSYQLRSWLGHREFGNRLPYSAGGQTSYGRLFAGAGAQFTHRAEWFGLGNVLTTGVDIEQQRDDRERHNNLVGGGTGALTLRQREKAGSVGLYLQDSIDLSERWQLTLGGRYDTIRQSVDDRFLGNGDDSDVQRFEDWNYSVGLSYRINEHYLAYARVATSFETPTLNELTSPTGGGFNSGLEPAKALNRELGLKGEWDNLRWEAVAYSILLQDELVPYTVGGSGPTYYRNAGRSQRDGVELSADYTPVEHWRLSMAYSFSDYRYTRFDPYDDKRLPGIPRQTLFSEVAYEADDFYARLNMNAYGPQYADNANTARVAGVALFNVRLGKRFKLQDQVLEPYVGLDNLTDRRYYDNLRINDGSSRYYEPGPGRTVYAGVKVTF
ncbi:TonB-dependent receptor family protein [Pseudomonas fontis]|uniref:TonB-dependent receptor n=1 Tax=Pseudomonas fontis TaxID=2942633 RepID=A0ABT5NU97_9PSED|nr:TonB-dependent receptor [Pseudomonas fontis]MDD0972985.1 TonB-dependent receptor [Pseudomonas fontis]MDD0991683.1 TonB-dependent receptor [Pseudomonas fontis]